jgi:hypothetical protein
LEDLFEAANNDVPHSETIFAYYAALEKLTVNGWRKFCG